MIMEDQFARRFPYLRLSITDVCNFRCQYCLPDGYRKTGLSAFLSVDEIKRLVTAFAGLGVWKIRLTGGEPTVRKDFLEVASAVAGIPGIRKLAVTTNGYALAKDIHAYRQSGITSLNVSIDSLNPERFQEITGHDRLADILEGINLAQEYGFRHIKINTVLLKDLNDSELDDFLAWIRDKDFTLRFIELMRTGDNQEYFEKHHISADAIRKMLMAKGWQEMMREADAGPAVEYSHADYRGRIGIIAPYSKNFCATCNRLRVTARGDLRLCLFGDSSYSLRFLLQSDDQKEELQEKVLELLNVKTASHSLHQGITGITPHLASLGG